ncbi:MAG: glucosamine--fructose-6-phosphate aminotransferase [Dictyoglomus sp. NZ13-RE01]|nr:MAG: glucosamine--fructose-6-phosphate aminotransferase [Dictyoglomus sp. NZ13-RE01]
MEKFMYKEIKEGVEVLEKLYNNIEIFEKVTEKIKEFNPKNIIFVARGTSDNACVWGRYYFESNIKIPVSLCAPSLYTIYNSPPQLNDSLVIAVSQSGESEDICEVVRNANNQKALTIGITNNLNSKLANLAQNVIYLNAGEEKSVSATKTYLAELFALYLLANIWLNRNNSKEVEKLFNSLKEVIRREGEIKEKALPYKFMEHCVILGRGYNLASALEMSLKLKETSYILAEPYSTADFLHGPLALVSFGFPIFMFIPKGESLTTSYETLKILEEKEVDIFLFSNEEALNQKYNGFYISSEIPESLTPLLFILPAQFFTYFLTIIKGLDPDNPRYLRKVTITK